MNIQAYRKKFILIAMSAMTLCLTLLIILICAFNGAGKLAEQWALLDIMAENGGNFPPFSATAPKKESRRSYQITEETEYRVRYFHVTMGPKGTFVSANLKKIAAVDETEAITMGKKALDKGREYGHIEHYLFKVVSNGEDGLSRVIFLDWEEDLVSLKKFSFVTCTMGVIGLICTFVIVLWLSRRAIQPAVLSAQQQKQFMTDASHELKTPLSAISVNMELLALEIGENEWLTSTNEQLRLMRNLVEQLINSARMDEVASLCEEKQPLDICELITDAVTLFAPLAKDAGRSFVLDIPEHAVIAGHEELLRRMLSVLCDNAIKHASGAGDIVLSLSAKPRTITLRIQNPWPHAKDSAIYERMFDRFYKADPARSKDCVRNGFGVGLSIARKAAQWHGGTIKAGPTGADQICFTVTLRRK